MIPLLAADGLDGHRHADLPAAHQRGQPRGCSSRPSQCAVPGADVAPPAARPGRAGGLPMPANFAADRRRDCSAFLPEIILTVAGTLSWCSSAVTAASAAPCASATSLWSALLAALAAAVLRRHASRDRAFSDMLLVDGFATFFRVLVHRRRHPHGARLVPLSSTARAPSAASITPCCCSRIVGQCLMAAANELIMIFIGLEISSIATYVLAGYLRDDKRNNESRAQVLPARIVRHRVLPLRRRLDLRHHRHHQSERDPRRVVEPTASAPACAR